MLAGRGGVLGCAQLKVARSSAHARWEIPHGWTVCHLIDVATRRITPNSLVSSFWLVLSSLPARVHVLFGMAEGETSRAVSTPCDGGADEETLRRLIQELVAEALSRQQTALRAGTSEEASHPGELFSLCIHVHDAHLRTARGRSPVLSRRGVAGTRKGGTASQQVVGRVWPCGCHGPSE